MEHKKIAKLTPAGIEALILDEPRRAKKEGRAPRTRAEILASLQPGVQALSETDKEQLQLDELAAEEARKEYAKTGHRLRRRAKFEKLEKEGEAQAALWAGLEAVAAGQALPQITLDMIALRKQIRESEPAPDSDGKA